MRGQERSPCSESRRPGIVPRSSQVAVSEVGLASERPVLWSLAGSLVSRPSAAMFQSLKHVLGAAGMFPRRPLSWAARSQCRARLSTRGLEDFSARLAAGPTLRHFLRNASPAQETHQELEEPAPYLTSSILEEARRKVYLETYGCQMNVNDTEIAWAILQKSGYLRTHQLEEADVILLVTCSVREKAEQVIWNRLRHLTALKSKRLRSQAPLRIGILGCMAERLREEILHREKLVDIVAGPDAYRDLPRLLAVAESGQQAANVLLSLDETYADVLPVQTSPDATSAFVSIMRGCDNMCSYCIVPFTRGRERSRPMASILREVQMLSDQVLQLIQERRNICKQLHLPAQSGSSRILEAMRRGYTREAYLELVQHVRDSIPGVSLSSDFIAGFCGETEGDHQQTVSLLRQVRYNVGFLFAYSMRQKTRAYHRLQDDVPVEVKRRRLEELISVFRAEATRANGAMVGRSQLVLVEGPSKRSAVQLCGRNDGNIRVVFPDTEMEDGTGSGALVRAQPGDYVLVKITSASSQTLKGVLLRRTTLRESAVHR
ncbi:mitochondrial tRNA methylthiotransferase CDK5RAP1 isoform X4 [Dermochelys coriacea]|uniref:mitochondrial tRNA methylthiotransferase CDK5RAP1 isoform X4 n=1 Tax=Dermochelys coriacea TaxID=27794 RepID=UPI001CA9A71C|nr:mitochondrial tRNA methylthiotransferase CDK5RAP1 isoform X4 [Dermochelys coriacea]